MIDMKRESLVDDLLSRRNRIFSFLVLVEVRKHIQVFLHGIFSFAFEDSHQPMEFKRIQSNE